MVEPANVRIRCQGIGKSYQHQRVLSGLDWDIASGTVVGLLGCNGAGKSTLIRCLLGLLRIDTGTLTIDGEDAWTLSARTKSKIGYVDQCPTFQPWLTGNDILRYVGSMYPHWNRDLCHQLSRMWSIPLSKPFGSLSPVEQQKIANSCGPAAAPGTDNRRIAIHPRRWQIRHDTGNGCVGGTGPTTSS
jgi:ABC-2 type transport system ATP-binding protein